MHTSESPGSELCGTVLDVWTKGLTRTQWMGGDLGGLISLTSSLLRGQEHHKIREGEESKRKRAREKVRK